jgi:transcriptional regulator PpsR
MDVKSSPVDAADRPFPRGLLGSLDASVAAEVVAAGGDVAFIIDRNGVICDMALGNEAMAKDGVESWLDRRWSDTVAQDSRHKVDELLRDALNGGKPRWREVNQLTPHANPLMIRYVAVDAGHEGRVIAIGRDDRAALAMQQRLMEAQQAMERDYARLRDAEFRYRLLFQTAGEAVLVVDASSKKIMEANPAADRFIGSPKTPLVGEMFVKIFDEASQDGAAALLTVVQSTARSNSAQSRLMSQGREFSVSASLFRQDRTSQYLVRISPLDDSAHAIVDPGAYLQTLLERMPDAFLVTDAGLKILTANSAFLDMARIGTKEQAEGQPLTRFLGRAGLDRNILLDNLRTHGFVRNFSTLLRTQYDDQEDVEVSAVAAPNGDEICYGFSIRSQGRKPSDRSQSAPELRRSVEQLTTLVGRVTLKELVRETTDLVERLCIEAALELTKNNRASAAEILGLSRQSLYSKLHRFGLGNLADVEN